MLGGRLPKRSLIVIDLDDHSFGPSHKSAAAGLSNQFPTVPRAAQASRVASGSLRGEMVLGSGRAANFVSMPRGLCYRLRGASL